MKIYVAVRIQSVVVGTREVYSKEYEDYLQEKYEAERDYELYMYSRLPEKMEPEYVSKNVCHLIPRIIDVGGEELYKKYADKTFEGTNDINKTSVWIYLIDVTEMETAVFGQYFEGENYGE